MRQAGGMFLGQQLRPRPNEDPRKVIRQYGLVWGRAARDADDVLRKKRNVSFLIKYDEEPNPRYGQLDKFGFPERKDRPLCMNCFVSGKKNIAAILAAIEKGDSVMCLGRVKSQKKNTKRRGEMWFRTMNVEIIVPAGLMAHLYTLYNSKALTDILEAEANEEADVWED